MSMIIYSVLLLAVAILSAYLAFYSLKKPRHHVFFALLATSTAIWAFGYMMELLSQHLWEKVIWAKIEYLGIVFIPVSWFATVAQYVGREKWAKGKRLLLFFIVPIATLLLDWTNELHGLIWAKTELVRVGGFPFLKLVHGPFFWVHVAYSYSLVFTTIILLVYALFSFPPAYRGKTLVLLAGAIIPLTGNILYVFGINPFYLIDLTPFTTFMSVIAMAFAVIRLKALDVLPIAREKVIEMMEDAVFVIDNENNIIDKNASGEKLYKNLKEEIDKIIFEEKEMQEKEIDGKYYSIHISPIYDGGGNKMGKLVIFHDITERKKAEDRIRQLNEELLLINKIVRHDVLNDLQIVQGFLEMEYKGEKDVYEKVMKRIEKIVRLMKRVKDLEHLASTTRFKEYDLRKVAENVAEEYDIPVSIEGHCKMKMDDAIYSVFDNIIMNAIIHGKADHIDITLQQNEEECIIKIADNGKGIPNEIKDKIFEEKFSYGESKGSGLGLYIVKKIIEKYGGSIEVKDNEPRGAVFIIKLRKIK